MRKRKRQSKTVNTPESLIDEYCRYVGQAALCSKKPLPDGRTEWVCVSKSTKELLTFTSKPVDKIVYNLLSPDNSCFDEHPTAITSYRHLTACMSKEALGRYGDLNEDNWEHYFDFMLLPPKHDKDTLRKQLLSPDRSVLRAAAFAVLDFILEDPAKRKAFLAPSFESLPLIKENFDHIDLGGIFASGNRFLWDAYKVIKGNDSDECFCTTLFDPYGGPNAEDLSARGFILIQPNRDTGPYTMQGVIQCPICRKKYLITEEYTGWHIDTQISWEELPE